MRIGKIFGVSIVLNPFFLLMLFGFGVAGLLPQALILFGIVLIHEASHLAVAKGYGLAVAEIELLPFGGVARIEGMIEFDPAVERAVALAGPLTNLFLAGICLILLRYAALPRETALQLIQNNLLMAGFNCLPALPLDGGRVYRAHLAKRIGYRRATERAASVGQILAALFAVFGAAGLYLGYLNLTLILLAFFVFYAARKEKNLAAYAFIRYLAQKKEELRRSGVLPTEQLVAAADLPVREIVKYFIPKRYHLVLLTDHNYEIIGLVTEIEIINALFDRGTATTLRDLTSHKP
ncbi:MAG: M50 family metallopeptidase [Firmicutes bacterium]|nr:M50 family metallopeptidase [Bacillota bacterium]